MKYRTKEELIDDIEKEHRNLVDLVRSIPKSRFGEAGVWGDDWNLKDLLAHLTEWEQMFLGWFRSGLDGKQPDLPATGYKWNQLPALNQEIWHKHRRKSAKRIWTEFENSYEEVLSLAKSLSQQQLFSPGQFSWAGKNPLTTYLGANTSSHYRTAAKILERWLRARPEAIRSAKEDSK